MEVEQKWRRLMRYMMLMMIESELSGEYHESDEFRDLVMEVLIERSELSGELAIKTIKEDFLYVLFMNSSAHEGFYQFLRYTVLPILQKDRAKIEEKRQRRLEFLADIFDEGGRTIEARVVRTIVKPTIANLNARWAGVSTWGKVRTLDQMRRSVTKNIRDDELKLIEENVRIIEENVRVIKDYNRCQEEIERITEDCNRCQEEVERIIEGLNRDREEIEIVMEEDNEEDLFEKYVSLSTQLRTMSENLKTIEESLSTTRETLSRNGELMNGNRLLIRRLNEDWLETLKCNVRLVFGD